MLRSSVGLAVFLVSLTHFAQAAGPPPISRNQIANWIESLSHDSARTRAAAARALAETTSDEAVAPLLTRLLDPDADVRLSSAFALGRIAKQPEKSIPGLTRLLFDSDEHVRYSAQWSLAQVASSLERPGAPVANRDRLDQLLVTAAATMAQTGAHQASLERIQAAIQGRRTAPAPVARTAESIQDLIQQLKSEDIFVQVKAMERVRQLDPTAAVSIIESLAKERDVSMMSILDWNLPPALARLGQPLVPSLIQLLQRRDDRAHNLVVDVLNEMPTHAKDAIPQLLTIVSDADRSEELREKAIFTIGKIGPAASQATAALGKLTADEVEIGNLRLAAARAIGQIGPGAKNAATKLIQVLESDDEWGELRIAAAQSLAQIAPTPATVNILIKQIKKIDDLTFAGEMATAFASLGEIASPAVPLLASLIEKSSEENEEACALLIEAARPNRSQSPIDLPDPRSIARQSRYQRDDPGGRSCHHRQARSTSRQCSGRAAKQTQRRNQPDDRSRARRDWPPKPLRPLNGSSPGWPTMTRTTTFESSQPSPSATVAQRRKPRSPCLRDS